MSLLLNCHSSASFCNSSTTFAPMWPSYISEIKCTFMVTWILWKCPLITYQSYPTRFLQWIHNFSFGVVAECVSVKKWQDGILYLSSKVVWCTCMCSGGHICSYVAADEVNVEMFRLWPFLHRDMIVLERVAMHQEIEHFFPHLCKMTWLKKHSIEFESGILVTCGWMSVFYLPPLTAVCLPNHHLSSSLNSPHWKNRKLTFYLLSVMFCSPFKQRTFWFGC